MFGVTKIRNREQSSYASRSDFCRIFQKDVDRLYLLSLLLTADATIAEQCFVGGLHIAQEGNHVFKEWAKSWARRAIIQNAIRVVRPLRATQDARPTLDLRKIYASSEHGKIANHTEIAAVVDLPAFERFVFVMSVLERYTDQECSLLLGCTRSDVVAARTRALEQIGKAATLQHEVVSVASRVPSRQSTRRNEPEHIAQFEAFSALSASA